MKLATATAQNSFPDIEEAQRVLNLEVDGLMQLRDSLGTDFVRAIDTLGTTSGRVIVSGMGKSGHIARKIAATLASTGTPSFFVHPSEASHGDLGMITKGDSVIALSNSGETSELANIIRYTRRYEIPLIGITSRQDSALAKASDVSLILPKVGEACPIGLAPTTSTTMMIALGDAIATTLLKRKSFSPTDFSVFHPGGSLGGKLVTVNDIMHTDDRIPLVPTGTQMSAALLLMTNKSFGCVGVIDKQGDLLGIITDGDLRRHMGHDLLNDLVEDVMTANPRTIGPNTLVTEVIAVMNKNGITSMFVANPNLDPTKPIGIVHIHDCLRSN